MHPLFFVTSQSLIPLSGMLFNHLMAILALKINQNSEIEGIKINGRQIKFDMFAGDIWNVIPYKQDVFNELMFEYSEFESFAGLY